MNENSPLGRVWKLYREGGLKEVYRGVRDFLYYRFDRHVAMGSERPAAMDREEMKHASDRTLYCGSETEFEISPPLSGKIPKVFEPHIGVHNCPPSFVCELRGVTLVGKFAICQTKDGKYLTEEMGTLSLLRSALNETYAFSGKLSKLRGKTAPIFTDFSSTDYDTIVNLVPRHRGGHWLGGGPDRDQNVKGNYGHWLLEDLPRLRGYEHYHRETDNKPLILLMPDPPSWMKDTLRLLGYSQSDWLEWKGGTATVSKLVVPKMSYIHSMGAQYQPSDRNWVAERMKSNVDLEKGSGFSKRVYVSRQGWGRSVVNFDQVVDALQQFGFEAYRPEELSIEDQIRLFSGAEVIVGPFGAGLTNMIFADEATVVELAPYSSADSLDTVYYLIASEQGLGYDYVLNSKESDDALDRRSDILVDIDELTEVVEGILDDGDE